MKNFKLTVQDNGHTFSIDAQNNSKFTGIGPILGVDGLYRLSYNIGVTGRVAAYALSCLDKAVSIFSMNGPFVNISLRCS